MLQSIAKLTSLLPLLILLFMSNDTLCLVTLSLASGLNHQKIFVVSRYSNHEYTNVVFALDVWMTVMPRLQTDSTNSGTLNVAKLLLNQRTVNCDSICETVRL